MLTNYEEWTPGFNPNHKPVVLWMEELFSGTKGNRVPTKDKPVTGPKLCEAVEKRLGFKSFSEVELRSCVAQIRQRANIALGSGGKGYFRIETPEELALQIKSLEERADSIQAAARALRRLDPKSLKSGGVFDQLFGK